MMGNRDIGAAQVFTHASNGRVVMRKRLIHLEYCDEFDNLHSMNVYENSHTQV